MTQDQPVIRIGELLVQSGVITTYDLSEAEKLSSHMKVQFGRLLIMAGCLTEEALECALEAQGLIKDGLLTAQIACEALAFAVQENIPLRQALEALDCLPQFGTSTLRLAELIHDANILDEERLHDAFDTSMETNRPLPEVLVQMECISPGLLSIMLRMQEQIRNDTLDREDSINELRGTFKIWKRADKAMSHDPMSKSAIIGAPVTPEKQGRFTSSFDTVNRLPAMSPEILASLHKESQLPAALPASSPAPAQGSITANALASTSASAVTPAPPTGSPGAQNLSNVANLPNTAGSPSQQASYGGGSSGVQGASSANTRASSSSASTRGGNDELNVDWILNDYANAPAGQPMPDGVILYSQGYFPPDPQKPAIEESFIESYSDEDEQRINDLLDVFASDAPAVAPPITGAPGKGQSGASPGEPYASQSGAGNQSSYASKDGSFAQSSYSAALAAAAADGWGVPDLAAAGANLSGAEMFARAQAELASSGWAYSQGSASHASQHASPSSASLSSRPVDSGASAVRSDAAASPSAYSGARTQPPVTPGPLGQPSFVTPVPSTTSPVQSAPATPKAPPAPSIQSTLPARSTPTAPPTTPVTPAPAPPPTPPTSTKPTPSAPWAGPVADTEDSLFSPNLKESISDALHLNPFKIRKVGDVDSSTNLAAASAESHTSATEAPVAEPTKAEALGETEGKVANSVEAKTIEDQESKSSESENIEGEQSSNIAIENEEIARTTETDKTDIGQTESGKAESGKTDSAESETDVSRLEPTQADKSEAKLEPNLTDSIEGATTALGADEVEAKESSPPLEDEKAEAEPPDAGETSAESAAPEKKAGPDSSSSLGTEALKSPPSGVRGKFGTKTGLAAKRKAEDSEDKVERNDVVYLLKSANFFSADELEDAIVNCLRDQNKAIEILGILGIIDKSNLDAAVRLQKLVKTGSVDVNKAIESLADLQSGKLRASELTEQLGIKKPKRRK
jgi:hypothetical protein